MPSRRELIAAAFDRMGAFDALLRLRRVTRTPWLTVVSYHRIGELEDAAHRYDPGVLDATVEDFDRQMSFMKRHFNVIDIDTLCRGLAGGKLPANAALVTFDDGYRACHDEALPILQRHGLTAAFFIATRFVEDRRMFWWDRIGRVVHQSAARRLRVDYPETLDLPMGDDGERAKALATLLKVVKKRPGVDVDRYCQAIEAAGELPLSATEERSTADRLIMTWEQVRALARAGMDIGSHTRSHRVLQTLAPEDLDDELRGSRLEIERQIGRPVRALAYPVGYAVLDRPEIVAAVERAGYQVAFSNANGVNTSVRPHRLDVRRVATDYRMPDAVFRAEVALPRISF
jgi:peptidoglycan/xylan/chitin deacetylase (PgdA/CDA1 family)